MKVSALVFGLVFAAATAGGAYAAPPNQYTYVKKMEVQKKPVGQQQRIMPESRAR
jgi:hypothetical protein